MGEQCQFGDCEREQTTWVETKDSVTFCCADCETAWEQGREQTFKEVGQDIESVLREVLAR